MRTHESVTPSGVAFTVRNLTGFDQNTLSKKSDNPSKQFNKMLADCMEQLGTLNGDSIKVEDVENLLSNDRKFILVVLRQFSLKYQKEFSFKYEWPVTGSGSKKDKEVQECSFNFTHENFPVIPYVWMRDAIEVIRRDNQVLIEKGEEDNVKEIPDGHTVKFPILFASYDQMLAANSIHKGKFPESGMDYEFALLDGKVENKWAPTLSKEENIRINMMIEMHQPKVMYKAKKDGDKDIKTTFDPGSKSADLIDCEHIRKHIKEVEGTIDTSIVIQHEKDPGKSKRVDLITLVDFFFPSQAL